MHPQNYNFKALIVRSESAPEIWVSVCLELGVISQGDSPGEARQNLQEAVEMVLIDDLSQGLDPYGRRPAEEKYQRIYTELLSHGRPVDLSKKDVAEREQVSRFAAFLTFPIAEDATATASRPLLEMGDAANGAAA